MSKRSSARYYPEDEKPHRTAGTQGPKPASTGPIVEGEIYTLDEFKRRSRWRDAAIRTARRHGLKVIKAGNICFIRGTDFSEFLRKIQNEEIVWNGTSKRSAESDPTRLRGGQTQTTVDDLIGATAANSEPTKRAALTDSANQE